MGCDIHMFVEYKKTFKDEQKWINGDYYKRNPHYEKDSQWNNNEFELIEFCGDRNYSLFSTLAGVRDYSDKIIPVAEPKYLPPDISEFVNEHAKRWEGDAHTHSWLTLKELKQYNEKGYKLHYSGLISPQQQFDLDVSGITPDSWCQGTNQEGYERREWSAENNVLNPLIEKLEKRTKELFQYEWQKYDPSNEENIRIVFWFDN